MKISLSFHFLIESHLRSVTNSHKNPRYARHRSRNVEITCSTRAGKLVLPFDSLLQTTADYDSQIATWNSEGRFCTDVRGDRRELLAKVRLNVFWPPLYDQNRQSSSRFIATFVRKTTLPLSYLKSMPRSSSAVVSNAVFNFTLSKSIARSTQRRQ